MKKIQEFLLWFVCITVGILIICAISFALSGEEILPKSILWQILLAGFITAIVTTFLHPLEHEGIGGHLLQYAILCAIMIFFGIQFGWIPKSLAGAVTMIVDVALVYAFTTAVSLLMFYKQTNAMNKALQEKYPDSED